MELGVLPNGRMMLPLARRPGADTRPVSVGALGRYRLWCLFRSHQWPLRDGDIVEVRTDQQETIARLPAAVVEAMVAHHLDGLAVQAYLREAIDTAPPERIELIRKPLALARRAVVDAEARAQLRAKRRQSRRTQDLPALLAGWTNDLAACWTVAILTTAACLVALGFALACFLVARYLAKRPSPIDVALERIRSEQTPPAEGKERHPDVPPNAPRKDEGEERQG